jgi:NADP-dependent 3-hydroxy acid dehydrogenase YdfG
MGQLDDKIALVTWASTGIGGGLAIGQRMAAEGTWVYLTGRRKDALDAEVDEDEFDTAFATSVKGTFFAVQKALPTLVDGASSILVSSISRVTGPRA